MAIAAFAAERGYLMRDVTIEMVQADGGVEKWTWKSKMNFEEKAKKARTQESRLLAGSSGLLRIKRQECNG